MLHQRVFTFFVGWMLNSPFVDEGFQTDNVYQAKEFVSGHTEPTTLNWTGIVHKSPERLMEDQTKL